jgi:VWFA-related protein
VVLVAVAVMTATLIAQEPLFRSSVDVIAVDVQVVDGDGSPIDALPANAFEVSIKGQRRKVISAEFVRHAFVDAPKASKQSQQLTAVVAEPSVSVASSRGGRTVVLAIDIGSFDPGAERAPMESAKQFLRQLEPGDMAGLFVFPDGIWIPPTLDRAAIRTTLDRLVGQHQPLRSYYNLKPWEIVDITTQSTNPHSFLTSARRGTTEPTPSQLLDVVMSVQQRECPGDADCPILIYNEGIGLATQLERQAQLSLEGLESLLFGLRSVEGRKSVVLVSGGILVSDRPEGRPDAGDLARTLGQEAARAHAVVYTIHVDVNSVASGASAGRRGSTSANIGRDRALYGTWLEQFSDAAGGDRLYVPTGQGDFAFDRVIRESSGYYLLGVEPASEDRDGQARELRVKVNAKAKGITVRSRSWVVIPPKGQGSSTGSGSAALRTR